MISQHRKFLKLFSNIFSSQTNKCFRKKTIITALHICFIGIEISICQSEQITGSLIDSLDQTPIVNCIVTLHKSSDSTLLSYTSTDIDGKWVLDYEKDQSYYVEFKLLGYDSKRLELAMQHTLDDLTVMLTPSELTLNDILIKAQRIGIQQKGDTIDYDLKSYTTGQEETLGDVLDALPGMEVSDQGDIKYNGSRVDVLLMEEKDILNNQHKLATEGIRADDVADVQIIENYKGPDNKSKKQSDKVAMNVELTDEAKARWRGTVSAGAGYQDKIVADANIFNINDVWSTTAFGRYNNTGESLMSVNDYLSMQVSMISTLNNNRDNLENLLPEHFLIPVDLTRNSDALIAANIHKEKADKLSTKLSIQAMDLNRNREYSFNRIYQSTSDSYRGESINDADHISLNLHYQDLWRLSKGKGLLRLNLPLSGMSNENQENINGLFGLNNIIALNSIDDDRYKLNPSLRYIHDLNEQWQFTIETAFHLNRKDRAISINDASPLFDTSLTAIKQDINQNSTTAQLSSSLEYTEGNHAANVRLIRSSDSHDINALSEVESFKAMDRSNHDSWTSELFYRYESDRWIFEPSLSLSRHRIDYNNQLIYQFTHQYDQLVRFSFSKLHFILLRYRNSIDLPGFNRYQQSLIIQDRLNLVNSNISPNDTRSTQTINLSYLNYQLGTGRRLHILFNHSFQRNHSYRRVINQENSIRYQWDIGEWNKSYSIQTRYYRPISNKRWNARLNLRFANASQQLEANNTFNSNIWSADISLNSRLKDAPLNGSVQISYSINSTNQGIGSINFHRLRLPITLKTTVGKLSAEFGTTFNNSSINSTNNLSFWELGGHATYQLSSKYSLNLLINDVLYLNGTPNITTEATNIYFQENSFVRYPGYITLSIKRNL